MLDKLFCDCNGNLTLLPSDAINIKYQNSAEMMSDEVMGAVQIQLDDPNNILEPLRLDCDSLDAMLLYDKEEHLDNVDFASNSLGGSGE